MPVSIQIFTLPDLTPVTTDSLDICTPKTYTLNVGSYRVIGTFSETGETQQADFTITAGVTTPVTLNFVPAPVQYTLTINTTTGGSTSPAPGTYTSAQGASVSVTAIPSAGYAFDHWVLDGTNYFTNPITVTMNQNHTLTAYFTAGTYTLTIGTTTGGSTNPTPGSYTYAPGSSATITAIPNSGYAFDHWVLDGTSYATNPITVTMNANHTLTAYFRVVIPQYTLTVQTSTGGTTSPTPGSYAYPENTNVQVTGLPSTGYNFNRWTLDGVEYTSNPITVLMNTNHTLTAYFSEIPPPPPTTYKININSTIGGTTDPPPTIYERDSGTTVTVTAVPEAGKYFTHWELDGTIRTENPITVTMDKDHTLLAVFTEVTPSGFPIGWILVPVIIGGIALGYLLYKKK